jgi:AbrB family looped-hinge helix DNA binding protein
MVTRLSTKGQVVVPGPIRRKLGLRAGDPFDVSIDEGRIVLVPRRKPAIKARIVKDPLTGFPVIDLGPDAPVLTHERVKELLADFP